MDPMEAHLRELEQMDEGQRREVLIFARSLRAKDARELERMMDDIIDENLEALLELAK